MRPRRSISTIKLMGARMAGELTPPNGRGSAWEGRTASSSGCSRTGSTVPAAAVPGTDLRQQPPGPRTHQGGRTKTVDGGSHDRGIRVTDSTHGDRTYMKLKNLNFLKMGSNNCEGHGGGQRETSEDPNENMSRGIIQ